jgi:hypothetical protein
MAQEGTPFLDLLQDEVVQNVIRFIPRAQQPSPGVPSSSCLAVTCRRLCTLVGLNTRQQCCYPIHAAS